MVARATADLVAMFDVGEVGDGVPGPAWNIKPTNRVPVVLESAKGQGEAVRRLEADRWSLTPSYSKELRTKFATFNARSETVAEKATFRGSVKGKRAILPADYYYEWHMDGKTKTPYAINLPDGELMAFAGLYTWWPDKSLPEAHEDYWTLTATILTRAAVGDVSQLHDRTPSPSRPVSGMNGWTPARTGTSPSWTPPSRQPPLSPNPWSSTRSARSPATDRSWWNRSVHEARATGSSAQWVV